MEKKELIQEAILWIKGCACLQDDFSIEKTAESIVEQAYLLGRASAMADINRITDIVWGVEGGELKSPKASD